MKMYVRITSNYGTERIYPACPVADKFALIAGTKTLSRSVVKTVRELGYEVVQVALNNQI